MLFELKPVCHRAKTLPAPARAAAARHPSVTEIRQTLPPPFLQDGRHPPPWRRSRNGGFMTIVALPDEISAQRVAGRVSLRSWLADRWAILFSHPQDFVQEQLEMDRWLSVLSRSFSGHDVATLALAPAGHDAGESCLGRLAALGGEFAAVLALDPPLPGLLADVSAGALRAAIAHSGLRFAMIIDPNLRCRRLLSYRLPVELPSPLDLIGWAVALRKRDDAFRPVRTVWHGSARHAAMGAAKAERREHIGVG
jgi:hypothetical protein